MKVINTIKTYSIWAIIALLLGVVYMRLLMGSLPTNESYGGFGILLKTFYSFGLVRIGLIIGILIAIIFIILDVLYLKRRLNNNLKSRVIKLFVLFSVAIGVGICHYILEKVIDVI